MATVKKVLVLGGTGKTGRRVVDRLSGVFVRIGSRRAPIPFDWEQPAGWGAVVEGMDAVYITFQPDLAVPGADEAIKAFCDVAVAAGVQKLVLLSGRGEPEASRCEQVIMDAGVDWTIVRASWFMQNFSESYMLEPLVAGFVALPVGEVGEPFVDADDIADIVVAALEAFAVGDDRHSRQLYEVTGPSLLSFREAVVGISSAMGKPIHYEAISMEEYAAQLGLHGVPPEVTALLGYLFTEVLDGRNAYVADGVERALGRPATDFSSFIQKARFYVD